MQSMVFRIRICSLDLEYIRYFLLFGVQSIKSLPRNTYITAHFQRSNYRNNAVTNSKFISYTQI